MKVICALRSARRQSLVHYLAALGEPHALHDLIVIRQHDPLCFLVPEGGEEVVEVAGVKGGRVGGEAAGHIRSEEHTSELQSLMRISYAVCCLKKKNRTVSTYAYWNY